MSDLDLSQLRNSDGSELSAAQIDALTAAQTPPPAAPPAAAVPPAVVAPSDAEKLVAVAKAGLDISSPLTAVIAQTYAGDLADPEAVRGYAQTLGWVPATPAPGPAATDPTGGQGAIRQGLATGPGYVPPAVPPPADPYEIMRASCDSVRADGFDEQSRLMVGVQTLVGAAAAGDDRVSVQKHHEEGRLVRLTELGLVNTQG